MQNSAESSSQEKKHRPTSLISRLNLIQRLRRSKNARAEFVESHLDKALAFQIRALRSKEGWTQGVFAEKLGIKHQNNVSARLENPNYGKHSLSTLKKIAATCDVALVVWFVPFSRFVDWVTGTLYLDNGLSESFYDVKNFTEEFGEVVASLGPITQGEDEQSLNEKKPPASANFDFQGLGPLAHLGKLA